MRNDKVRKFSLASESTIDERHTIYVVQNTHVSTGILGSTEDAESQCQISDGKKRKKKRGWGGVVRQADKMKLK